MSDKSLTQKDESGVIGSVSPMNLTKKLKSGSSASARNNVTKSEKAKMRSTAGIIVAPLDSAAEQQYHCELVVVHGSWVDDAIYDQERT